MAFWNKKKKEQEVPAAQKEQNLHPLAKLVNEVMNEYNDYFEDNPDLQNCKRVAGNIRYAKKCLEKYLCIAEYDLMKMEAEKKKKNQENQE